MFRFWVILRVRFASKNHANIAPRIAFPTPIHKELKPKPQPCFPANPIKTTAEKYVADNFVWTPEMDKMAENIKSVSKTLNGKVESPLADELLK